jgi:signal transduction histidine kinase
VALSGHEDVDEIRARVEMTALAQIASGWPYAASLATAVAARGLQAGRRRSALNEALHELRRPLQALALATPGAHQVESAGHEWSVQMAAVALERLDRAINGEEKVPVREAVPIGPLLASAVGRWQARAAHAGGSLELRWGGGATAVEGDRCEIAQALDNLIVNAIEHGGPRVLVEGRLREGRLRLSVADSGRASRPESRREGPVPLVSRLSGRRRRGHGLRVVRRIAAAHGGEFRLRCGDGGTEAVLELPLPGGGGEALG